MRFTWPAAMMWLGAVGLWIAFIETSNWLFLLAAILMFVAANIAARLKPASGSCAVDESRPRDQSRNATD